MLTTHSLFRSSSRAAALLGLLALAGAGAAPAGAAPTTLKLSVKGTQTTTWKYVKQQAATCDWPETEEGTQTITLASARPVKLKASAGKGGKLSLAPAALSVPAKASLKRTYDRRFADISSCPGGGGTSGGSGAPPQNVAGSAQCAVAGAVELRLGGSRAELYGAGELAPTGKGPKVKAGSALLRGAPQWSKQDSWSTLPALCSEAGQPDADIGITEGRGEWSGGLIEAPVALPMKQLAAKSKAKGAKTVRVRATVDYPNAENPEPGRQKMTGRTVLDLKLTLRR